MSTPINAKAMEAAIFDMNLPPEQRNDLVARLIAIDIALDRGRKDQAEALAAEFFTVFEFQQAVAKTKQRTGTG
jgi:hypothetical protein